MELVVMVQSGPLVKTRVPISEAFGIRGLAVRIGQFEESSITNPSS